MPQPRKLQFDPAKPPWIHCISRCVRRNGKLDSLPFGNGRTFGPEVKTRVTTDPLGRQMTVISNRKESEIYKVLGPNDELIYHGRYAQHRLVEEVHADGQTTSYEYDATERLKAVTHSNGVRIEYDYHPAPASYSPTAQQLAVVRRKLVDQVLDEVHYTYPFTPDDPATTAVDEWDRRRVITLHAPSRPDEDYTVTEHLDRFGRVYRTVYPDGSDILIEYDKFQPAKIRDRQGLWTHFYYDGNGRRLAVRDPAGRITGFRYDPSGNLIQLIDPEGGITRWHRDVQGRVVRKQYQDGSEVRYDYDYAGRLQRTVDARGVQTRFYYALDGSIARMIKASADGTQSYQQDYTYDPDFPRLSSVGDDQGSIGYGYHPFGGAGAGQVASVDGIWPDDTITYGYDTQGRIATHAIGNLSSSYHYDSLQRLEQVIDPLGTWTTAYHGDSGRVDGISGPNNWGVSYAYGPVSDGQRLAAIQHTGSQGLISRFGYGYRADGLITTHSIRNDDQPEQIWRYGYDLARQLVAAVQNDAGGTQLASYSYSYDDAGNRTTAQQNGVVSGHAYNLLNQWTGAAVAGEVLVRGYADEPARVWVDDRPAQRQADHWFQARLPVQEGDNTFIVRARDGGGNERTQSYRLQVPGLSANTTVSYDADGNLTAMDGRSYDWDLRGNLAAITYPDGSRSVFTYNVLNQRIRIEEYDASGGLSSARAFLWEGSRIVQERDATGANVLRTWFAYGLRDGTQDRFLTRDHLGSVREIVAADGSVVGRFAYSPYGIPEKTVGDEALDQGYTGHFWHAKSGLWLTHYRGYDPGLGRWISRDPLGVLAGVNVYGYVSNGPINAFDPDGRIEWNVVGAWFSGFGEGFLQGAANVGEGVYSFGRGNYRNMAAAARSINRAAFGDDCDKLKGSFEQTIFEETVQLIAENPRNALRLARNYAQSHFGQVAGRGATGVAANAGTKIATGSKALAGGIGLAGAFGALNGDLREAIHRGVEDPGALLAQALYGLDLDQVVDAESARGALNDRLQSHFGCGD